MIAARLTRTGMSAPPSAQAATLARGTSYRFSIGATNAAGAALEPSTTMSAIADGVRVVDGEPVLSVGGVDVPLSQITRIR